MASLLRPALAAVLLLAVVVPPSEATAQPPRACVPPRVAATPSDPGLAALQRGNRLVAEGRPADAVAAYEQAREVALGRGDVRLAAQAAANRARAAIGAGEVRGIAAELDRLETLSQGFEAGERAQMLIHLGRTGAQLFEDTKAAAVLLSAAKRLERAHAAASEAGDTRLQSFALGYLAELYRSDGQLDQALGLVEAALRAGLEVDAADALFRWRWLAGRIHVAAGRAEAALAAYRHAGTALIEIREQAAVAGVAWSEIVGRDTDALYEEFLDLVLKRASETEPGAVLQALLAEARDTLEARKADELRDYFEDECLAALRQKAPEDLPGAVVVYPVLLPERLEIIVGGSGRLSRTSVSVDRATLTAEVRALRHALPRQTTREYQLHASRLYEWLVRPIQAEIEQRAPETLVFVPEGALRTIPFAALFDGVERRFLVERYAIAIVPSLTLTDPRPLPREGLRLLAAGLSESVAGYPALEFVEDEIETLRQAYPGKVMLNEEFALDRFERAVAGEPFDIVHIASHAEFADDASESFLLAHDGRLSMNRLASSVAVTRFRSEHPLELLTLSACETAAGNDRAALGLAGIALRAGARSALATLWSVNDQSSGALVKGFYTELGDPEVSRAEALRRAQLALLEHRGMRHPAFWAPFVLISSWL